MTDTIRLGLVGCGRIAQRGYAPALALTHGVELVAVADPVGERRRTVAPDLPGFESADALLRGIALDGIVAASPPDRHLADARAAVAAGVPVLVEKPPGVDSLEAAELAALGPGVSIGFNRRFEPGIVALREALGGAAPERLGIEFRYRQSGWGAYSGSGDVLLDVGPHLVDLARWLTGREVDTLVSARLEPGGAELALQLGTVAAAVTIVGDRPYRESIEASDESGRLLGSFRAGGTGAAVAARLRQGRHPLVTSLATELEAFGRRIRGEPAGALATGADGVAAMRVLDEARAAVRT